MVRRVDPRLIKKLRLLDKLEAVATESLELRQRQDLLDAKRDQLIVEVTELGATRAEAAEAALLTRGRVQQILSERRASSGTRKERRAR